MGVTFTPNIGLAKPDETELAKNWTLGSQLADDNNQAFLAAANKPITTYTSLIKATTTDPNIGTLGVIQAEYQDLQGIIMGSIVILVSGTGISAGSGEYGFKLPLPADPVFHTVGNAFNVLPGAPSVIGEGYIFDSNTVITSGTFAVDVVTVAGVSYGRLISFAYTTPAKTTRIVGSVESSVMAASDRYLVNFMYKKQ